MHIGAKIAATAVAGILLGLGATLLALHRSVPGTVRDGAWSTNLSIGSAASGPYTRALIALHGLFAVNRNEAIYYDAERDESGQPLSGACEYVVEGRDPDARWWSLIAYGADDYLIANPTNRYSVDRASVVRNADGKFRIAVGTRPQQTNWIAVTSGRFSLTLRLYDPGPAVARAPAKTALPALRRVRCS